MASEEMTPEAEARKCKKRRKVPWWAVGLGFLGVSALVTGVWYWWNVSNGNGFEYGPEEIEALFSGIALAAVSITLLLQSKELEYQREELDETQGIMEGQQKQLEIQAQQMVEQNERLKEEALNHTFFNLLEIYRETLESLHNPNNSLGGGRGRSAIKNEFEQPIQDLRSQDKHKTHFDLFIRDTFNGTSYLGIVHRIMVFIHDQDEDLRTFYMGVFMPLLSVRERKLLYFFYDLVHPNVGWSTCFEESESDPLINWAVNLQN